MSLDTNKVGQYIGICLLSGLIGSAFILGQAIKNFHTSGRYVTVKGLAERDVVADLAVWTLQFNAVGNDLSPVQAELDTQKKKIMDFLTTAGIKPEEIQMGGVAVSDRNAQEYSQNQAGQPRFILRASVLVRSANVNTVYQASQKTSDLIRQGVVLKEDNCRIGPSFLYTKLNDIKPEILAEATKTARKSAQQFALDSGSDVGSIRQANQGVFSIVPRDQTSENQEQDNCSQNSSMNKRVRVVTTIDYYLKD